MKEGCQVTNDDQEISTFDTAFAMMLNGNVDGIFAAKQRHRFITFVSQFEYGRDISSAHYAHLQIAIQYICPLIVSQFLNVPSIDSVTDE